MYCRLLSPEYDKLVDLLNIRKDIIIGRLEAGANDITANKYGIDRFPIVALFKPGSKRISQVYQGERNGQIMANWVNSLCPKLEVKEEDEKINNTDNSNKESLQIDLELFNNKMELTDKKDFIKQQFFKIKKQLDEIETKIDNGRQKSKTKPKKHKRIRITFDFSFINIFLTLITLLIIFAFYKTGRKLLINAGHHKE